MIKKKLRKVFLRHAGSGRVVPVEVPTVFGRSDAYYRYTAEDERPERLREDVASGLAALNYVKISSDDQVSRTHGLLDPRLPAIQDLNSTNGVQLNHRDLPTREGEGGALVTLNHDDRLQIGRQVFDVTISEVSSEEAEVSAQALRHGFVGSDYARRERGQELKRFLSERKGFQIREAIGWPAIIANCYHLQSNAEPEGIAVCALLADANGGELILKGEPMLFAKLLPLLSQVPGRKVVVLETLGDPKGCEEVFASMAYEDMALISCTAKSSSPEAEDEGELVVPTMQSREIHRIRESLDGGSGAYDDAVDGLDALIGADTNILNVTWIGNYEGHLKVTFGERERSEDHALSHSLRLGSSTFRF